MRILNRPMFRLGGSTGQGITSGLRRQGYALGNRVEEIMGLYGGQSPGYNVYDFLTDWGLRMASASPRGNVIQTAAAEAIEPHKRMMMGKAEAGKTETAKRISAVDLALKESLSQQEIEAKERIAAMSLKAKDIPSHIMSLEIIKSRNEGEFNLIAEKHPEWKEIKENNPDLWAKMKKATEDWMATSPPGDRNIRPNDVWEKNLDRWSRDQTLLKDEIEFKKAEWLKNYLPLNPMYKQLKADNLLWSKDTSKVIDMTDDDDKASELFFDATAIKNFASGASGALPSTTADWVSVMKPILSSYEGILFRLPNGEVVRIIKSADPDIPIDVEKVY
jgi:hypothetical protein